jgi:hypothetical protein
MSSSYVHPMLRTWRELREQAELHYSTAREARAMALKCPGYERHYIHGIAANHGERGQLYAECAARLLAAYFPNRGRRPQECYP